MISQHMGLALDLSKVKAIYIDDMKLVFELDNILQVIYNEDLEEDELKSFPNTPVMVEYSSMNTLHECFKRWVELWEEYSKKD